MRCPEPKCSLASRGCDIESAWDEEGEPIWAVSYECPEGHKFIAEFDRENTNDDTEEESVPCGPA